MIKSSNCSIKIIEPDHAGILPDTAPKAGAAPAIGAPALVWMQAAIEQAQAAQAAQEVPVGAVVVLDGRIIGSGQNNPIGSCDPTAHAEINALRAAARYLGNYRLDNCELFVTLEPCIMCAGAILQARIKRLVFGAAQPRVGAAGSVSNVFAMAQLNHQTQVQGGVLADVCANLLQDFFRQQRSLQQEKVMRQGRALCQYALRTPESHFASLPAFPAPSFYINDLPGLAGLRLHYVDSQPDRIGGMAWLYLHGIDGWSYSWRSRVEQANADGQRSICVDLIGFGKSDKPKRQDFHQFHWHIEILLQLLKRLGLTSVHVLAAESVKILAQQLQEAAPEIVLDIAVASTDKLSHQALHAPFPNRGYEAGPKSLIGLLI